MPVSGAEKQARNVEAPDPFSDLGQWVIKVLIAPRVPAKWLEAPRGPLRGVSELAERAEISAASASRLVTALKGCGFLDDSGGELRIVRLPALLESWRAASSRPSRELRARFLFPTEEPAKRLETLVAAHVRRQGPGRRVCLGLFSACKVLGLGRVRGAPLHLFSENLSVPFLHEIGLFPVGPGELADLTVRRPRLSEAMFRGAVVAGGLPVVDALQCWLDVGAHPARGVEQAREILDRLDLHEDTESD